MGWKSCLLAESKASDSATGLRSNHLLMDRDWQDFGDTSRREAQAHLSLVELKEGARATGMIPGLHAIQNGLRASRDFTTSLRLQGLWG